VRVTPCDLISRKTLPGAEVHLAQAGPNLQFGARTSKSRLSGYFGALQIACKSSLEANPDSLAARPFNCGRPIALSGSSF
jgi:hypothetical protein